MTQESSEQPRETRDGTPLVERFDKLRTLQDQRAEQGSDAFNFSRDTVERVGAGNALMQSAGKVSSPELASLAAKYVDVSASDWPEQSKDVAKFLHDVRSLAASVLAQAEGNPRK